MTVPYLRRVGSSRPSHLMFTGGVGGLVELPNFTIMVQGVDEWNYSRMGDIDPTIHEPRVLAAVRSRLSAPGVKALRSAPWLEGQSNDPSGPANQVGVPVIPFPAWFRCTFCDLLGSLESGSFGFKNRVAGRPFEAEFVHLSCRRRDRFAVPARFLVGCLRGHLDEFPYAWFVHEGAPCADAAYPVLKMVDLGRDAAANVKVRCESCGAERNMIRAQGQAGSERLPACRGRHAQLGRFEPCDEPSRLLVLGASNQWFGVTVNALSVPPGQASELEAAVDQLWESLSKVTSFEVMQFAYGLSYADVLGRWPIEAVWAAVEQRRRAPAPEEERADPRPDLLGPEWELLTRDPAPPPTDDFAIRSVPVPPLARGRLAEVRQVERLRLVRALIGFTRFDAPDPEEPELVAVAPLGRAEHPDWVPATEVRGEGLFVRLDLEAVHAWERSLTDQRVAEAHRRAFAQFRKNRYSSRYPMVTSWDFGWPELRYYLVHTLAHVVLRAIALECGYAAASLAERIYARPGDDTAGFLIYTAVPDAEGTLGGLVSLGEPEKFTRVLDRALRDARACSSDPLCAESGPSGESEACYAASCHVCLFLSETSCERGNRFLDRRLLVGLGRPELAFWPSETRGDAEWMPTRR